MFFTPVIHPVSDLEECDPGWDKFQGFCYHHFTKRLSWEAAEQHCRMCGGHLISVMTPEEQDYINGKTEFTEINVLVIRVPKYLIGSFQAWMYTMLTVLHSEMSNNKIP